MLAELGDTMKLDAAFFPILGTSSLDGKQNIVNKSTGTSSTILNFSNQVERAQGLSITNCITFKRIKSQWLGGPYSSNGAYVFYPVQCENIIIEHCIVVVASDTRYNDDRIK